MKVSQEELDSLKLNEETARLAADLIRVNGYVILEGVLPKEKVLELRTAFKAAMDWFINKHGEGIYLNKKGFNEGTNHLGILLPFEAPFNDPLVIEHPFALDIIDRILGKDHSVTLFSSNTSLPGGKKTQPVHPDYGARFGDLCDTALPITDLVLNIPLVDVTDENGPMEIWPGGTHLLPDRAYGPNGYNWEQLTAHMTSVKVHMPAGSILIRDVRMLHRGTPNRSNEIRPNLALIYSAIGRDNSVHIPQETYDNMSERAKHLFRYQKIGAPVIEPTHE
ncbi:phytanoyl-CoA dioxygenase family protein [Paenibacillus thermotolerans]|uniref:phytanoyl-CoA dioxygenase family protein n=1 Tax=Paenibacillus thermotolerans TaxID=3027807 RepID=UPI0023681821|nr:MULTISPECIES: phytanoyl-CoA dioxygenase family protein [unclassified Paenibacillus]